MSAVHLLIIKDDKIYLASMHYRVAKKVLEEGIDSLCRTLKPAFLDAGYLVIDANQRIVLNAQEAFRIPNTVRKKFDVRC